MGRPGSLAGWINRRRRRHRIDRAWPGAGDLVTAFGWLRALPV
jgi:hypothetical protein